MGAEAPACLCPMHFPLTEAKSFMTRQMKRVQLFAALITFVGAAAASPPPTPFTLYPCSQQQVDSAWAGANAPCTALNLGVPMDCVEVTNCNSDEYGYLTGNWRCQNGTSCNWICYYDYDLNQWVGDC
jgi:hypothetical protein